MSKNKKEYIETLLNKSLADNLVEWSSLYLRTLNRDTLERMTKDRFIMGDEEVGA